MSLSESPFDLIRVDVDGHPVLVMYGALDIMTSPKLHEAFGELIKEDPAVVLIDFANVTFVDSSGLGALVSAHRHMDEKGGQLRLVAVPASTVKLLAVTGLADRFHVFESTDSATSASPEPGTLAP